MSEGFHFKHFCFKQPYSYILFVLLINFFYDFLCNSDRKCETLTFPRINDALSLVISQRMSIDMLKWHISVAR